MFRICSVAAISCGSMPVDLLIPANKRQFQAQATLNSLIYTRLSFQLSFLFPYPSQRNKKSPIKIQGNSPVISKRMRLVLFLDLSPISRKKMNTPVTKTVTNFTFHGEHERKQLQKKIDVINHLSQQGETIIQKII